MSKQQTQGATPPATDTTEPKAARALSAGVIIGRAIEKLSELDALETEALARSPQKIREDFAKKRAAVLEPLNEAQRKSATAAVEAMRPSVEVEG